MSGAAYDKTPAYRRGLWLMLLLSFVAPLAIGATCYLAFQDEATSVLIGIIAMQAGHSIWFHIRLVHLRPFIHKVLDGTLTEEPPYHSAERWQDDPRYAIPAGLPVGGVMGVVIWMTDDPHLPWWVLLPLALGFGLFFGTAMWFVHKHMKGR